MEKLKVYTKYQLRRKGGVYTFEDKLKVSEGNVMTDSIVKVFNDAIDEVLEFNKVQRKENERMHKKNPDEGLRPLSSSIYYEEDKEATKALQADLKAKEDVKKEIENSENKTKTK
jgi:hypothetical protein